MNILPYCNHYYFKLTTVILVISIRCCLQHLDAKTITTLNGSSLNGNQKQFESFSPIQILTNKKIIRGNLNFLNMSIAEDLENAVIILDKIRSKDWILEQKQIDFFQKILNSKIWKKSSQLKHVAHCKNLLDQWSTRNDQKIARYFFHGFHLLLYPSFDEDLQNKLFANNPPNSGDLASGFLSFIHQMYFNLESTLKIYFYQLNQPQIVDAIVELAYWIGPQRIKIIVEEDYLHKDKLYGDPSDHQTALKKLLNAGIAIRTDQSYLSTGNGESHHKFAIIDPDQIFTGSWNPTSRGTNRNFNHAFWLQSKNLLKLYDHEFRQIWAGNSQSHKISHWDYRRIDISGGKARVFFSPQDPLKEVIISSLQQAKYKIVMGLFFLTDPDIIDILRLKRSTGVKVIIVIDNLGLGSRVAKKRESLSQILRDYQLEHWKDDSAGHWHHKAAVIDQKLILSGSANWSKSAFTKNDENLLQIEHPELAIKLEQILKARKSFVRWSPNSPNITEKFLIPEYWRIIREKDALRIQLPTDSGEWQVRLNEIPIKTKISKPQVIEYIESDFFNSKKDVLIDLYHPRFKRLHSLFLSNQDGKLSKKSLSFVKITHLRNPFSNCSFSNQMIENCLENKFKFLGCHQANIGDSKAGLWKNCDSLIRIH